MRIKSFFSFFIVLLTVSSISYGQTEEAAVVIQIPNETEKNLTIKDLDTIKSLVTENPEAYAAAVAKFESLDPLLNYADVAVVYFGYAYTPEYKGGYYTKDTDAVRELLEKEDYEGAHQKVIELRKINPSSLELVFYGIISSEEGSLERRQMVQKFVNLCDCITRFGEGTSDNPYRVIRIDDEYRFLYTFLNVDEITSQALVVSDKDGSQCDALSFRLRNIPFTLYFDVTEILALNRNSLQGRHS